MRIFSFLTPIELVRCASVCRTWLLIADRLLTQDRLDLSGLSESLTDKYLTKIIRKSYIHLRQINLKHCTRLGPLGFHALAACVNLQDVNLSQCDEIRDESIQLLFSGCQLLLYLNLSYTSITDTAIRYFTEKPTMLRFLSLAYCLNLTQECVPYFEQSCGLRNLIYLDLSGCVKLGSTGFASIFQSLTKVRYWILNNLPCISDDELEILGSCCPVIETLELINSGTPIPAQGQPVYQPVIKTGKSVSAHAVNCKRGENLNEVSEQNCVKLKSTMPSTRKLTDKGLFNVTRKGIRRLLISDLQDFSGKCFDTSLTEPSQQGPGQMNSQHLPNEVISNTATMEYLTQLNLLNCSQVS
ncbi:hypothetical protein P879_04757 [Paragonimus westermani]|uniref:F-box domain-containing protein n=1 Tax=Paragonimus westermani TaxID=34504 RepID=A0A8T0DB40_9TREM|nr:hypothetical protein P879_04757 [Paragonimus westermani]